MPNSFKPSQEENLLGIVQKSSSTYAAQCEAVRGMLSTLMHQAELRQQTCVFVCIGSDRTIGDSLGPLTGTLLKKRNKSLHVFGTLDQPVHAFNLEDVWKQIKKAYFSPLVICVDASVGTEETVGAVLVNKGPVKPGSALKKILPSIGDYHLLGVVNYIDPLPATQFLNDTRLHTVYSLAETIVELLSVSRDEK